MALNDKTYPNFITFKKIRLIGRSKNKFQGQNYSFFFCYPVQLIKHMELAKAEDAKVVQIVLEL